MGKFEWRGNSAIHTPTGVCEHGDTFEADEKWMAQYPQRDWRRRGLILPYTERPAPKTERKNTRGK